MSVSRSPSDGGALEQRNNIICCGKIHLREWTIKAQIRTGILCVSALLLIVLTLVSVITVLILGGSTRTMATNALEFQIRTNAYNFSDAYAKEVSQTLVRRAAAVQTVATATSEAFYDLNWEYTNTGGDNSKYAQDMKNAPGAKAVPATDGSGKVGYSTTEMSSYYIPKTKQIADATGCSRSNDDPTYGEDMRPKGCYSVADRLDTTTIGGNSKPARKARDRTAILDVYFKQFVKSMPDLGLVYIGFENSGLFRQYPGSDDYFSTAQYPATYDPRKRPWYITAREAGASIGNQIVNGKGNRFGPIVISEPYEGYNAGVWMITVAQAMYNPLQPTELLGVVGFDISIQAIQKHIVDEVKFLEGGIVTLIESESRNKNSAEDRIVVAHVDFSKHQEGSNPPLVEKVEKEIFANKTLFNQVFTQNGTEDYQRNGELYLLAHTNIMFPHKYTVITLVPNTEAMASIQPMIQLITSTELGVSFSAIGISLLVGIVVFFFVSVTANTISAPVNTMVKVAEQIVNGAAEKDLSGQLSAGHIKKLEEYAQVKDKYGKDLSGKQVKNEMIMLAKAFLSMTQGLEKDSNRKKKHVAQPENPYYIQKENDLMNALQNEDSRYWASQGGNAPTPQYAMAIATAVPVQQHQGGNGSHSSLPIASAAPYSEGKNYGGK